MNRRAYKTYIHIYNDKKWNQGNMKVCDKRKSHISSKLHMIYISSVMLDTLLLRRSLHFTALPQLHVTPLHYTCWHFSSSHLNFTHLHFTTLSFGLTPFKFPTTPFHLTSLHFTSLHFTPLHCTALLDDFRHTSVPFISPRL